jgi:hypothetical protein
METSADRADSEKRGDDLHDRSALVAESGVLQRSNKSHLRIQGIDLASVFFLAGT